MKFTLIIPTKNRHETAIKAVQSGTMSRYDNIEIIVTDGSDNDTLGKEIKKLKDPRIKYFHHTKSLPMRDNWEFGVSKATGDYVSIIGDDDALMPDGFSFASELIKLSGTNVLYCSSPIYKWPDYPLVSRRNLIMLKLPTTVVEVDNPRSVLKEAYEFKNDAWTGPGIYHGIISMKFLDELKSKRGSYFVDEVPDFDSGYCTLLYADKYLRTNYPIFISGHSSSSNSGSMHIRSKNSQSLSTFASEASISMEDMMLEDFDKLATNSGVIAGAMLRFLPEINRKISGKKITFNKQNMFNQIASSVGIGYENTTFKAEVQILKKIAQKWKVSAEFIPKRKYITLGSLADKGVDRSAMTEANKPIKKLMIDGTLLGVNNILDAIKVVESSTVDWAVLLNILGSNLDLFRSEKNRIHSLDLIIENLENENFRDAQKLLEDNMLANPLDNETLLLLGIMHYNQSDFNMAIRYLSRSLSFNFSLQGFDAYFHSLVKTNQLDCARLVLDNYSENIAKVNDQLNEHCNGVLEMASGNYSAAADIFSNIRPQIDTSLYFYCAAYSAFLKGQAANANKFVKQAISFNENKEEYLELEAEIKAAM